MELVIDREEFLHRIATAICLTSETHTQNKRLLEMSNRRHQYRTSLSAVVTAFTTSNHTGNFTCELFEKKFEN